MNILITIDELKWKRSRDLIPCKCKGCDNTFHKTKNIIQRALKGTKKVEFCSRICFNNYRKTNSILHLKCEYCHKDFDRVKENQSRRNKSDKRFCCKLCANKYYGEIRVKHYAHTKNHCQKCQKQISKKRNLCFVCNRDKARNDYIERWLSGLEKGYSGKTFYINPNVRRFLFKKYNNQCRKCGWCEIHPVTKKVPLEVNHINGNPANCKEENLELLCPNCHSLTHNFRALNKNSCRIRK